jgi:histidyl-tRNA synthetase
VPLALVVGPDELARDEVVLKDLRSGEQHSLRRELIVDAIRGARTGGSR